MKTPCSIQYCNILDPLVYMYVCVCVCMCACACACACVRVYCDFLFQNDLTNIVYDNTCFKNPENPTCIDLFLTNFLRSFQNTTAVTTGLSDFHKMTVTVLKNNLCKPKPKTVYYRCYKTFYSNVFRKELRGSNWCV